MLIYKIRIIVYEILTRYGDNMAKPINATPVLKGEDAKRFIERLSIPPTKEERLYSKEAKRVYENTKFTVHR